MEGARRERMESTVVRAKLLRAGERRKEDSPMMRRSVQMRIAMVVKNGLS